MANFHSFDTKNIPDTNFSQVNHEQVPLVEIDSTLINNKKNSEKNHASASFENFSNFPTNTNFSNISKNVSLSNNNKENLIVVDRVLSST